MPGSYVKKEIHHFTVRHIEVNTNLLQEQLSSPEFLNLLGDFSLTWIFLWIRNLPEVPDLLSISDIHSIISASYLLYRHTLRKVPRLVHIQAPVYCNIISKELQRDHRKRRRKVFIRLRYIERKVCRIFHRVVSE